MLLSHWHFCSSIKLSVQETADYLDLMFILERRANAEECIEALNRLAELDELRRAYAIPTLVSLVLSDSGRHMLQSCSNEDLSDNLISQVRTLIRRSLSQDGLSERPIPSILNRIERVLAEDVPKIVWDQYRPTETRKTESLNSYLETAEFSHDIFWLSLLNTAGAMYPDAVRELDFTAFLDTALRYSCVELPWQLAFEIYCLSAQSFKDLQPYLQEGWMRNPACIGQVLKLTLLQDEETLEKGQSAVYPLLQESFMLTMFERNYNRWEKNRSTLWIDPKATPANHKELCSILWQISAWETAFSLDRDYCVYVFQYWWGTPVYGTRGKNAIEFGLSNAGQILLKESNTAIYNEKMLPSAVSSPWQRSMTAQQPQEGLFQDFPYMRKAFSALRSFCSAYMLRNILSKESETDFHINYYRLLLNLGDAFRHDDTDHELSCKGRGAYWSAPLCGLGLFAQHCIYILGIGIENKQIPEALVNTLVHSKKKQNDELNRLRTQGYLICAYWAAQSIRYGAPNTINANNPWFMTSQNQDGTNNDPHSMAKKVCIKLFSDELYSRSVCSIDALELLYQKFRYDPDFYYTPEICWDEIYLESPMRYQEDNKQITAGDLLLAADIPVTRWMELDLQKNCFDSDAWPLVLTLRLNSVLHQPAPQGLDATLLNWYQQWQSEVFSIPPQTLRRNRILMFAISDLLRPHQLSGDHVDYSSMKTNIISDVIDLIYEATDSNAVYDLMQICAHLSQKEPHFPFSRNMLRMAQSQHLKKLFQLSLEQPQFHTFLESYILSISDQLIQPDASAIRTDLNEFWEKRCVKLRDMRAQAITPDEWNPLEDRFLHREGGKLVAARPTLNSNATWNKGKAVNRFREPASWENHNAAMSGIIVDSFYNKYTRTTTYRVNCGSAELVEATDPKYNRTIGDIVQLRSKDGALLIHTPAWQPGPESETICVRIAELSVNKGNITMKVRLPNGEFETISEPFRNNISDILDLWTPDTSQYLQGKLPLQSRYQTYEANYSSQLQAYVPAKRSFARLLLEQIFTPSNPDNKICLTFIRTEYIGGEPHDLFSTEPGMNYLIPRSVWTPDSRDQITENAVFSLKFHAGVSTVDGAPRLQLDEAHPMDDTNIVWEQILQEGSPYWMECGQDEAGSRSRWISTEFRDQPVKITCQLKNENTFYAHDHTNVQLIVGGWDRMCQRKQQALCEKMSEYRIRGDQRNAEQIAFWHDLRAGNVVRMQRMLSKEARSGYYSVLLSSGILAQCAAESVSMLGTLEDRLCMDRLCIVENVYYPPSVSAALAEGIALDVSDEEGDRLEGIVTVFSPVRDYADNDSIMQEVTFLTRNGILSVNIPMNKFQNRPQTLGARVTAVKQNDGTWCIQAAERRITIRALWKLQRHQLPADGEIIGAALGRSIRVPGEGYQTISQDYRDPVLHLWPDNIVLKEEPQCGITDNRGSIKSVWKRNCDPFTFPYAKYTDVVQLNQGSLRFWGEANRGEFGVPGSAWSVDFSLGASVDIGGIPYYDIRRLFHREQTIAKVRKTQAAAQTQTYLEIYDEWVNGPDRHVYGEFVGNKLKLHNMKVPEYTDAFTAADSWIDTLPMLPNGAQPWVVPNPERPYLRTVRALLCIRDNQWYASCREAEPFRLNLKLLEVLRAAENEPIHCSLYYAGPEKDGYLRFEWGHGYSFLVHKDDIVDHYGNNVSMELFYGDLIREFCLRRTGPDTPSEFGWHLVVPTDAIQHEITWHIWQDAQSNILQLLRVKVDRNEQSVEIKEVSMVEYSVSRYQKSNKGWAFRAFHNGSFTPQSVRKLLDEDAEAVREQVVIAQVDTAADIGRMRGIPFEYISVEDAELDPAILHGKTLCLTAGHIAALQRGNYPGNDYCLDFHLPDAHQESENTSSTQNFTVNVIRRAFSLDESKLRVLAGERSDEFYRKNMLVQVFEPKGPHEWKGSVLSTPMRHPESLREWVQSKSNCLVVLDKPKLDSVTVEVSPGILCRLPLSSFEGNVHKGAIALLRLVDGEIRGRVILPGDSNYIPAEGRPVELLPKDDVYRPFLARMRGTANEADNYQQTSRFVDTGKFTIASFPQLEVSNQNLMDEMICKQPPRLGWLQPDKFDPDKYFVNQTIEFKAAKLLIDRYHSHPKLHYVHPGEKIVLTDWNRLSYMDDRPAEIANFACLGKWHYHDKETAVYDREYKRLVKRILPSGNFFSDVLLFPNTFDELRFPFKRALQNVYSAREIAEYGLPTKSGKYPIAYSSNHSFYVELMPGRVVELPKDYLFHENGSTSLSNLNCRSLVQGDLIHLSDDVSFDNGQRQVNVTGFTFGSRHYFGLKRNFLPILRVEPEEAVLLGSENAPMIYPTSKTDPLVGKTLAYINYRNELVPYDESVPFENGDTVMLTLGEDGYFHVVGYQGSLIVKRSHPAQWENAQWIYELLGNYRGKEIFFNAVGGIVTAKVSKFIKHDQSAEMSIMITQDNPDQLPVDTILGVKCLGLLSLDGRNDLLMCTGRTILRVPAANILPALSGTRLSAVVKCLVQNNVSLWLHKEEDGWHSGIAADPYCNQVDIDLMHCIDAAEGFLCSNINTRELYWLPRGLSARVENDVTCAQLWAALSQRPKRQAQVTKPGLVSLIDTSDSAKRFLALRGSKQLCRAIPMVYLRELPNHTHSHLAELYPMGDLVYLNSEERLIDPNCGNASLDPIPLQIVKCHRNHVRFVPRGAVRIRQQIPTWINSQLRMKPNRKITFPPRFKNYNTIIWDAANNRFSENTPHRESTSDQLCYLASWLLNLERNPISPDTERLALAHCRAWLQRWMDEEGTWLASGFTGFTQRKKDVLDLRPLLAAIVLLNRLKHPDNPHLEKVSKELAVHFTRMVGLACDQSVHIEILLKDWLACTTPLNAFWKRFSALSLGGVRLDGSSCGNFDGFMTEDQVLILRRICTNIEGLNKDAQKIKVVARALLHSVSQLDNYRDYCKDLSPGDRNYIMNYLALYGRILTPGISSGTIVAELPNHIAKTIERYFTSMTLPLSVLTDRIPLSEQNCQYAQTLCQQFHMSLRKHRTVSMQETENYPFYDIE